MVLLEDIKRYLTNDSSQLESAVIARLRNRTLREINRSSLLGILVIFLAIVLAGVTGDYPQIYPQIYYPFACSLILLLVGRGALSLYIARRQGLLPEWVFLLYFIVVSGYVIFLGSFVGVTLLVYGFTWLGFVLATFTAGITAGGFITFYPWRLLTNIMIISTLAPGALASFILGEGRGHAMAFGFASYLIYLLWQASRWCRTYWQAQINLELLQLRAEDLSQAREQAEAASEAKSSFLATMSHEIRTPLNGVMGMLHIVLNSKLNAEQHRNLQIAQDSAQGLMNIINDILDFSKVEAGKLEILPEPFELDRLLATIKNMFSSEALQKQLAFSVEVEKGTPACLVGDVMRIRQVLINFIGNALKFTRQGEVRVAVGLDAEDPGSIRFSVSDTGIGLDESQLEHLFDSFSQADRSTTRRFGGTGLGLAISRKLVSLMGGTVEVSSKLGEGSNFTMKLPVIQADSSFESPARLTSVALQPDEVPALSVLIVEDNSVNQLVVATMLEKLGHSTTMACDGKEGVAKASQENFDLILMDVEMPEMDGLEATRIIRADGINTPIIALTAHATADYRRLCIESGMNDYMSKPIGFDILREKIARAVRQPM